MLEKSVFPKEFRPYVSLIFSSSPSILLSSWESLSSGFGGVGGGPILVWDVLLAFIQVFLCFCFCQCPPSCSHFRHLASP